MRHLLDSRPRAWLTAAALLLLAGCDQGGDGHANAAQEAPPPPSVTVAKPLVKELVEWDEFTGRFEAEQQVRIQARVTGYLDSVLFQDGDIVEAGQPLFVIDPRPFEAALSRAQADVQRAQSQLELADLELGRAERLVSTSAVARSTFDQRQAERRAADSALQAALANQRQAELDLGFTKIAAPFKGRVSDRRVDVGNLVDPSTLLTTIVSLDPIYFVFDMSEQDFLAYQRAVLENRLPSTRDRATSVNLKLVDDLDWAYTGTMNFVVNVVDQSTGTVRARAVVANPDGFITPGQFGTLRLPGSNPYPAVLIPDQAVVADQARRLVLTVDAENKVVPKEIRPGPRELGLRVVRRGLEAGDRVIIDGLMRARPGSKVAPQDGTITPAAAS
jgi:RND family efflux transporter MFP subunit